MKHFTPQDVKRIKETPLRRPKWLRHLRALAIGYLVLFGLLLLLAIVTTVVA